MKRFNFIFFICLFLSNILFAVTNENPAGEVPFLKKDHYILVKAKINDFPHDYNFIIDTGGLTFIDKAVVEELNLKQRGFMAKITTLNMSGYQIENIFCFTTFDFTIFRGAGIPIHGIIGSNLMERFKVTFDFQECFVIFSTDTTPLSPPDNGLYFTFKNHPINYAPLIKFKINQQTREGMIDTGQPFPIVIPLGDLEEFKKINAGDYIRSQGLMIKWPQTTPEYNYLTRLQSCEFGNLKINNMICIFGEIPPLLSMPLIGSDFLFQFKMIINYPKDEMILIPNPDSHFEDNQFSWGLNLNLSEENEIYVEGIWENSPADKADIQVGDQVLSFNSIQAAPENLMDLIGMLKNNSIESILLEIKNQNGIRKLNLHKVLLF